MGSTLVVLAALPTIAAIVRRVFFFNCLPRKNWWSLRLNVAHVG
jgi:hypothetical protein